MTPIKTSLKLASSITLMLLPLLGFAASSASYCTYTMSVLFPSSAPSDQGYTAGVCINGGTECYQKILYPSDPSYTPASTPCGSGTISFTMSGHGVYQGIVNFTYSNGKFQGIQTESELGYTVNAMTNSNEISVQLIPPS